jgi:hypothetical protein
MTLGAMCVSVDAKETSISTPAITHAVRGTRVFTGTPAIVIMVFPLVEPAPFSNNAGKIASFQIIATALRTAIGELTPLESVWSVWETAVAPHRAGPGTN